MTVNPGGDHGANLKFKLTEIAAYPGLSPAHQTALTRDQARAVFGQVMGLVALTLGCLALGAYIGRDLKGGLGILFFVAGFACIFGPPGWDPVALPGARFLLQIQRPLDPSRTPSASPAVHKILPLESAAELPQHWWAFPGDLLTPMRVRELRCALRAPVSPNLMPPPL